MADIKPFKVIYTHDMINIESEDISFALIPDMYQGGRAGIGLQVSDGLDREHVLNMCIKISDAVLSYIKKVQ